jgi:hypothetical protein
LLGVSSHAGGVTAFSLTELLFSFSLKMLLFF